MDGHTRNHSGCCFAMGCTLHDDLALACTRIKHQMPPSALCGKADALICCCMILDVQWPADV